MFLTHEIPVYKAYKVTCHNMPVKVMDQIVRQKMISGLMN